MLMRRAAWLLVPVLLAAGVVATRSAHDGEGTPHSASVPPTAGPPARVAPPPAFDSPATATITSATLPTSEDALLYALADTDPLTVLSAADALAARGMTSAIAPLTARPLALRGEAAPSVIDALGRLARVASPEDRATATRTLAAWLASERRRDALDAPGNVLAIYEALGRTGDRDATTVLARELGDPTVSRAAKTAIAKALGALGDPGAAPALSAARREALGAEQLDPFEMEVRDELVAAIDRALAVAR